MRRVLILFLVFLLGAAFGKTQGDGWEKIHFFPLAWKLTEHWPGYLAKHCEYVGVVGMAWVIFDLERRYVKEATNEVMIAAILISGRWVDYFVEGNHGWPLLKGHVVVISYDTVAFVVFAFVFIKMLWKQWISILEY